MPFASSCVLPTTNPDFTQREKATCISRARSLMAWTRSYWLIFISRSGSKVGGAPPSSAAASAARCSCLTAADKAPGSRGSRTSFGSTLSLALQICSISEAATYKTHVVCVFAKIWAQGISASSHLSWTAPSATVIGARAVQPEQQRGAADLFEHIVHTSDSPTPGQRARPCLHSLA